jgi:hypothetical protein
MPNITYNNWVAKTKECGLTNEQACGAAMLYAWTLIQPSVTDEPVDTESFWTFLTQDEFNKINDTSFTVQDFVEFIPIFKLAGEMLRVKMPLNRKDADDSATTLLNLFWQDEPVDGPHIDTVLRMRHRFDLLWCQRVGECLREEIRTPLHAYVFANQVTHGFSRFDPEGFGRILTALLSKKSPIVSTLTSKKLIKESCGFEGYEPFQITLLGFVRPEIGEEIWNLQRVLFYSQPSGRTINLEKQYFQTDSFVDFADPLIEKFINQQKSAYFKLGCDIASEYILRSNAPGQYFEQLNSLLDSRYKFSYFEENVSRSQTLLMNVAAFYTICCLRIKNVSNQISKLPSLKMVDDIGLLWTKDVKHSEPLLHDSIQCFDVMLSWRYGAAWGLFIETTNGFTQRAYVEESTEIKGIASLLTKICVAYHPKKCVLAFLTKSFPLEGDPPGDNLKCLFLSLERGTDPVIDVYRTRADLLTGLSLKDYLGRFDGLSYCQVPFDEIYSAIKDDIDLADVIEAQEYLIENLAGKDKWQFSKSRSD